MGASVPPSAADGPSPGRRRAGNRATSGVQEDRREQALDVAKAIAPAPWEPTVPQQAPQQVSVDAVLLELLTCIFGSSFALTKL